MGKKHGSDKIKFKDIIGVFFIIIGFLLILFSVLGLNAEGFPSDAETWAIFGGVNLIYILFIIIGIYLIKKENKQRGCPW